MAANVALTLRRLQVLSRYWKKASYSTCAAKPEIHVSKTASLMDEKIQIFVKGLSKHRKVTLHSLLNNAGKLYAACGHYSATEKGEVDTFGHPSHGGTFDGIEPMGLFWSMKSERVERPRRLMPVDVMTPFDVKISLHDGFLDFDSLPWSHDFECLVNCTIQRHYAIPGVCRIPVKENGIYGTLFLPPGDGPFPTVIDIFGMSGGILEQRAPLLASHGIASLSLAYVNHEDLPKMDTGFDFHYFLKAFDWLASHPAVDENAMGTMSTCVGGSLMGVVAMRRPTMKCLACINNLFAPVGKHQMVEGELVKAYPFSTKLSRGTKLPEGIMLKTLYREDEENHFSPIWRHGLKVLHFSGLDDPCINPLAARNFFETIPEEFRQNFTHVEYSEAGHFIEPPYTPLCTSSFNDILGDYLLWGGKPKPHADAQEDSWRRILLFFQEHLQNDAKSHVIHQTVEY